MSFPSTRFLQSIGNNIIAMERGPRGDLYILEGNYGTLYKVPNSSFGLLWGQMRALGNIPSAVGMAFDDFSGEMFVTAAQVYPTQPPTAGSSVEGGGGGGGQQGTPSRLYQVFEKGSGSSASIELMVLWEGSPLNLWMSPVNGLKARGGRVYIINNAYPDYQRQSWSEMLLFNLNGGKSTISQYLPAHVLRTTLSGLAFLN